jgi:hypothetical protein
MCWSPDSKNSSGPTRSSVSVRGCREQAVTVAQATAWEFSDYAWSPDSKWIAFARPEEKRMTTIPPILLRRIDP